jgi:hypothetical protein
MARMLYRRWETLAPAERLRLQPLAHDVKERALDVRGAVDDGRAERELEAASHELADELERVEREQRAA